MQKKKKERNINYIDRIINFNITFIVFFLKIYFKVQK